MPNTSLTRHPERGVADRVQLDELLDAVSVVHVAFIDAGHPVVLPTGAARDGNRLLIHGSSGSRWMRSLAAGTSTCVSVTALDGIIIARSAFESSFRYRSAALFGTFTALSGEDKRGALNVLVDRLIPGRTAEVRPSTVKELAATQVLAMAIEDWSLKVNAGWPQDGPTDMATQVWAGVVPVLGPSYGSPQPAPDLASDIPVPPSVLSFS
jgi:nitroimidazol reductase NimA-like FMN-containing flavoprotein (pyridoxamine 5'-phosphate oxidase superfamily)